MLKNIIYIAVVLGGILTANAQQKGIQITNLNTQKEIFIPENKRIKVRTVHGVKLNGRLVILDNKTIQVHNKPISLLDIEKIKRNPLLVTAFVDGFLYYVGGAMVFVPFIVVPFTGDTSSYYYMILGAATMFVATKSPNILRAYKKDFWSYHIITR